MKNQIRFLRFPGIAVLPIFAIFFAGAIALGQTLEEQFQAADAELNRVYKELRTKLNDEHKAELKKSQLAWIKEKDLLSKNAKSESEKFTILEKITAQRAIYLLSLLNNNKTPIVEAKKSDKINDDNVIIFGNGKNCPQTIFNVAKAGDAFPIEVLCHTGYRINRVYINK